MTSDGVVAGIVSGTVTALLIGAVMAVIFMRWVLRMQFKIRQLESKVATAQGTKVLGRRASALTMENLAEELGDVRGTPQPSTRRMDMHALLPQWCGAAANLRPPAKPRPVVLITDMGGSSMDIGDMVAVVVLRGLESLGFISVRGIVVADTGTGAAASSRVTQAAELVQQLGFERCTVACTTYNGGTYSTGTGNASARTANSRLWTTSPPPLVRRGTSFKSRATSTGQSRDTVSGDMRVKEPQELFDQVIKEVEDKSLIIFNVCSLTELANLFAKDAKKLATKLDRVVIFGQVSPSASPLAPHPSLLNSRSSSLAPHPSLLTPYLSPFTPHPSPLTPHPSPLTRRHPSLSPLTLTPHSHPSPSPITLIHHPRPSPSSITLTFTPSPNPSPSPHPGPDPSPDLNPSRSHRLGPHSHLSWTLGSHPDPAPARWGRRLVAFGQVREPFLNSGLDAISHSGDSHDFFLKPDPSHAIFASALPAAESAMTRMQEMGVRMTVISR